jgi:hypothetical protein
MFLPHEWGPHPKEPGHAACVWCRRPFVDVGGTACAVDTVDRIDLTAMTMVIPEQPDPPPPATDQMINWGIVVAAVLAAAVLIAAGILLFMDFQVALPACT